MTKIKKINQKVTLRQETTEGQRKGNKMSKKTKDAHNLSQSAKNARGIEIISQLDLHPHVSYDLAFVTKAPSLFFSLIKGSMPSAARTMSIDFSSACAR